MIYKLSLITAALSLAAVSVSAQSRQIDASELNELPIADVVILGEVHDNPEHHAHQALAVGAIGAKALVFEMLTNAQALQARPDVMGSAETLGTALGWADGGWPDFDMYYPIFTSVDAPVIFGGALRREVVRQAVKDGAAGGLGGAAALFGLNNALDDHEQVAREAGQMAAHCDALPVDMLSGMVEAQRLRDAALAQAVIAAMAETGGPVAVITGNGHTRKDWGVPHALGLAAPELSVLTVGQFEAMPEDAVPYDLWLVTDPVERDDPCAAFK